MDSTYRTSNEPRRAAEPTTADAIIVYDQQDPHLSTRYADYARIIAGIEQKLWERYGVEYKLYASEDPNVEYWTLLEEDLRAGVENLEHVIRIYDRLEEWTFMYDGDKPEPDFDVHRSLKNNVFTYTKAGVALARMPVFREHGISNDDLVFAVSHEALLNFLADVRVRQREQSLKRVTVFTDGRHGINRQLEPVSRAVSRDDVIMPSEIKQDIYRSLDRFFEEDRSFYEKYDIPYKRGILLYGHPGNGKTTLVKSIAGSVPGPVAYWQITEYTSSESIEEVFEAAGRMMPMVLVIEDIDSMPTEARSFFLNTLDGATSKEGIFLIGTTNYPEKIDPGLMNRAGRFDRAYEITLPDEALRLEYFRRKKLHEFAGDEMVVEAARITEGFTFAQLGELYVSAALHWHEEGKLDLHEVIQGLRGELDKSRKGVWLRNGEGRMGFHF
ncbi:AAA family ATPase [Paenibacillus sp. JQZ6Y-1]